MVHKKTIIFFKRIRLSLVSKEKVLFYDILNKKKNRTFLFTSHSAAVIFTSLHEKHRVLEKYWKLQSWKLSVSDESKYSSNSCFFFPLSLQSLKFASHFSTTDSWSFSLASVSE